MAIDVEALARGDRRAWRAFVDEHAAIVPKVIARTLGEPLDSAAVSDAAQDVMERLCRDDYRVLRTFDPSRATARTWLAVIARNVAVDQLRRRRPDDPRAATSVDALEESEQPATDGAPLGSGAPEPLRLPAGLLSERQRLVLHLLYEREFTPEEVAQRLGIKAQTVRSAHHKAMMRLRNHYGVAG